MIDKIFKMVLIDILHHIRVKSVWYDQKLFYYPVYRQNLTEMEFLVLLKDIKAELSKKFVVSRIPLADKSTYLFKIEKD